jgi:4'-phosphopantetheinyl transferase
MIETRSGRRLELGFEEVDLWLATLDCSPILLRAMAKTLSYDEAERADRFHFACDRARFIATHGILRDIISRYLGCTPAEIRLAHQSSGKPQLGHTESTAADLRFNLSHCTAAALYVISRGRDIGVDIESIRPGIPWERIASRFFAPGEIAKLQQWPAHRRTTGFFMCWTRKEAYVKARGEGLSIPFDTFEVSAAPGEEPALLAATDSNELKRWSFWEVPLGESFAGALVVDGRPGRVRLLTWHWSEPRG